MNNFLKHLSLVVILFSLCISANTHSMFINKLTKTPITLPSIITRSHNEKIISKYHSGSKKPKKIAWMELEIENCSKNIPLSAPENSEPSPKFTMMPGQEKEFTKAMVQLQSNDDETKN